MTEFIAVKNFERFQHYKDRKPPWIKLYNDLLDDYTFCCLPDASKWLAVGLWLLASRHENRIPSDPRWIARMVHATEPVDIGPLVSTGFVYHLGGASKALAKAEQDAMPEREEEREKESSTTIVALRPIGAMDLETQVSLIIRAANRGMGENPAIGTDANPIREGHGSRQDVHDWLKDGVPPDLAQSAVYEAARAYRPSPTRQQPHTMKYFTGPVIDAFDKHKAQQTEVPNGAGRLSRNGGPQAETGGGAKPERGRLAAYAEDGDAA